MPRLKYYNRTAHSVWWLVIHIALCACFYHAGSIDTQQQKRRRIPTAAAQPLWEVAIADAAARAAPASLPQTDEAVSGVALPGCVPCNMRLRICVSVARLLR